jgi:hypothetical protein
VIVPDDRKVWIAREIDRKQVSKHMTSEPAFSSHFLNWKERRKKKRD